MDRRLFPRAEYKRSPAVRRDARGKASRLVYGAQLLGKALRPAARDRGVVIDEDIGAVVNWRAVEDRLDQGEGLAVLVARRVGQFVIGAGELPVEGPEEGAAGGFFIGGEPPRQECRDRGGIRPVFYGDAIAGIAPWWQRRQRRLSLRRDRNGKRFEHRRVSSFLERFRIRRNGSGRIYA